MTFLPIVTRELSIASRRRTTFWTRLIFAALGVVIAGFTLAYVSLLEPRPGLGAGVFATLSGMGFALCAVAGVFLTADCLSEEKREGTLGLLFLTDIKGHDVVLGKLVATSLTALYGVLAIFPVLGLTLILGGVTAGEFWRMVLVFLNTLLLSLATGLCVSALSQETQRARAATALLLLGIVVLPPVANYSLSLAATSLPLWLLQFSPLWGWMRSFDGPYGAQPWDFWRCVLAVQATSWGLLLLAAILLPWVWQEGRLPLLQRPTVWTLAPAALARRTEKRRELMTPNPIRWLAQRGPVPIWAHWMAFALLGSLVGLIALVAGSGGGSIAGPSSRILPVALRAAVALEACRFFVELRQTGALEPLLCTPLSAGQLLDGPCHALIRRFWLPVLIGVIAQLAPVLVLLPSQTGGSAWALLPSGFLSALGTIALLLDLFAITWVGMLLGLTSRKPGRAAGHTVLWMVLLPAVVPCSSVIMVLLDVPLILWARGRLHRELRPIAGEGVSPAQLHPPRNTLRGS